MHEIKIYGYISNVAEQEEKEVSLLDVQRQLNEAGGKPVLCRINSHGGDAEEGFAIYYELRRYAKENRVKIKTFGESRLGSIATIIFLAGDERELTADLQPFVHKALFDTDEKLTEAQENELKVLNTRLARHYEAHTDLTFAEAYELMEKETFINTSLAKEMRFATSIEEVLRPVALKRFDKKINTKLNIDMTKNPKNKGIIAAAKAFLKSMVAVNKIVYTADEKELDFTNLEEDEVIEVGAYAEFDGSPATGEFVMADGKTFVFDEAGMLTEIKEPEAEATDSEEVLALREENATLAEQLEAITLKATELATENKKQSLLIANAKLTTSKEAPSSDKPNPKESQTVKVSEASKAISNINKYKKTK